MPETTTTTEVPIQGETVLRTLEERTQIMRQFRRAFRDYDATNQDAEQINFPTPNDRFGDDEVVEVDELTEYNRHTLNYGEATAAWAKYGFEVIISDEAVKFSRVDAELDAQGQQMEAEEAALDSQGYELLSTQNNDVTIDTAGSLSYEDVVDAYTELSDQGYNPNNFELLVGPQAFATLAKDDSFNRATEAGDALARNGMLGEVFGVPVAMTNTGDLSDDALLVDTSKYGYEATWENTSISTYREDEIDGTVYKVRGMWGFAVTDDQAALALEEVV